jgi:hypothetical protein
MKARRLLEAPARRGDWMTTFTGRQFWPLDPAAEDVVIEDIAHALSLLCGFAGHCTRFYSVAQHSVLVSHLCAPGDALVGLLHDAAEAYIIDLPRPIKRAPSFLVYRLVEGRVHRAIAERFGIPDVIPSGVKWADEVVLATEARDLMNMAHGRWAIDVEPIAGQIKPWTPDEAEHAFLDRFQELAR